MVYLKSARGAFFKTQNMSKLTNYIKDTRGELKHVSWPTRKQAIAFTVITIVVALLTAVYLGFLDYIFALILQKFVL